MRESIRGLVLTLSDNISVEDSERLKNALMSFKNVAKVDEISTQGCIEDYIHFNRMYLKVESNIEKLLKELREMKP